MNRTNAKSFRTRLDNRAYTLAELLLVVGLLSVLSGLGMVGASRMLRDGRQAALDKTAQALYLAVQRNLTAAKLSGATFPDIDDPAYQSCVVRRSRQKPVFGDGAEIETVSEETPVCQLWKGKKQNATLENIVFRNVSGVIAISEELLAACWVITFDPSDGVVLDAYFGQYDGDDGQQSRFFEDLTDAELVKLTAHSYRLERGALIGYYGSDATASLMFPTLPETPLPDVDFDGGSPDVVPGMELPGDDDGDASANLYPDAPGVSSDVPQTPDPSGPVDADPAPDVSDADMPASLMPEAAPAPDDSGDVSALLTPDEAADNPETSAPDATATRPTPANDPDKIKNVARKLYCWIGCDENPDAPIVNAEKLVTRLNCWVPKRSAFDDKTGPVSVDFTLKVRGVSSGKTKTFQCRVDHFGFYGAKTAAGIYTEFASCEVCREEKHTVRTDPDGLETTLDGWLYSYPVILDSLSDAGETAALHQDRPFRERFPVSEGFIPGENVMLRFEVDVTEDTKARIWESLSDAEKANGPGDNASVADKTAWLDEHAALWKVHRPDWDEYPVCNSLFADASVVDGDGVYVAEIACKRHLQNLDATVSGIGANLDAVSVRAAQIADIVFDAETVFTPISNDKLTEYDGRGHVIDNLQGAGLFGTLDGGAFTLSNLTLRSPVIVADGANVGAFVGKAVKPVALENLTLADAEIRVTGANAGGVIGQAVADVTAHGLKVENLRLTDADAQTVGGVIGLCRGNVALSDAEMVNPKLRGGAGTIAGGVIGKADGQVMISSARLYMSEDSYRDADLDAVRGEWLAGGEYVGGLIGYAAGNVTIDGGADQPKTPSFAATVVSASVPGNVAYAGGLAGYVQGALNADYAWADCYVVTDSGAFVGGLAGRCGNDSAFTHCYAAGFAVGDADHMTVAGFAPNAVERIRDAYSIFDADGYGLAEAGDVSEAYYVRGHGVGQVIDRDALSNLSLDGFRTVPETQACFYALSDADFDSGYPYPILDGQSAHYNDFKVRAPLEIPLTVELVFRDTSGDALDAAEIWDSPEQLREALFSVSSVLRENQDARARLTIQAVAGETLSNVAERLTFDGYALDAQSDVALTPETDTVKLVYARKRHVLSYDLDGGVCHDADAIAAKEAAYGRTLSDDIPDANAVKKDGYDFKGWTFYRSGTNEPLTTLPMLYGYAYDADGFLADENGQKVAVTFEYHHAGALPAKREYSLKPLGDATEFQLYNENGAVTLYGETVTLKDTDAGKEWTAEYQYNNWLVVGADKKGKYYYVYAPDGSPAKRNSDRIYYKNHQFYYSSVYRPLSVSVLPPTVVAEITLKGRATLSAYRRPLAYGALRDKGGGLTGGIVGEPNWILSRTGADMERVLKWDDVSSLTDAQRATYPVYHIRPRCNGELEWRPAMLDEVLVTPDKLRMPDFDVTAQAVWAPKNA